VATAVVVACVSVAAGQRGETTSTRREVAGDVPGRCEETRRDDASEPRVCEQHRRVDPFFIGRSVRSGKMLGSSVKNGGVEWHYIQSPKVKKTCRRLKSKKESMIVIESPLTI
jgi:hypothetical protein